MSRTITGTVWFVFGGCWLTATLCLGVVLVDYLFGDIGFLRYGSMIPGTLFIAMLHITGLTGAFVITLAVGIGLCAYGITSPPTIQNGPPPERFTPAHSPASAETSPGMLSDTDIPCTCCGALIDVTSHLCGECGWTQPCSRPTRRVSE